MILWAEMKASQTNKFTFSFVRSSACRTGRRVTGTTHIHVAGSCCFRRCINMHIKYKIDRYKTRYHEATYDATPARAAASAARFFFAISSFVYVGVSSCILLSSSYRNNNQQQLLAADFIPIYFSLLRRIEKLEYEPTPINNVFSV